MDNKFEIDACTISSYNHNCFDKLSVSEKAYLDSNSVIVDYKGKEMLCKQGGFVSHILYLEAGLAKVYLNDGRNTLVLKLLPEGNFIGLASVSQLQSTHQYSAMAYIDCQVRQIKISAFRELVERNSEFAQEIIDILSANSVQLYGRFFCLMHKQSYGRLADILLCLSGRVFKKEEFYLPLSRKELAELSGMTPETVVRILRKFQDDGLIELKNRNVRIIDHDKLRKICNTG